MNLMTLQHVIGNLQLSVQMLRSSASVKKDFAMSGAQQTSETLLQKIMGCYDPCQSDPEVNMRCVS